MKLQPVAADADLDGVRHAHDVSVPQKLALQVAVELEGDELIEERACLPRAGPRRIRAVELPVLQPVPAR